MTYQPGTYVYPVDLPRRVLCRIAAVETHRTRCGVFQILELVPLDGPWRSGTRLVRLDDAVAPAQVRQLWRSATANDHSIHDVAGPWSAAS
jgi:hypothetical protein